MSDLYPDADPEEFVTVVSVGAMTLRSAVRRYIAARETALATGGVLMTMVAREVGKDPASFDVNDLEKLAEMERFR